VEHENANRIAHELFKDEEWLFKRWEIKSWMKKR
jgi:hypothetical protein